MGGEGIGQLLQPFGLTATKEGIGGLPKVDALFPQAMGEPMMLVETDAGRKGEVGTEANEHSAPVPIVEVEVVLNHPAGPVADASDCLAGCRWRSECEPVPEPLESRPPDQAEHGGSRVRQTRRVGFWELPGWGHSTSRIGSSPSREIAR